MGPAFCRRARNVDAGVTPAAYSSRKAEIPEIKEDLLRSLPPALQAQRPWSRRTRSEMVNSVSL